ncbi:hypothetical protein D3C80_1884380 [compost metagenome]
MMPLINAISATKAITTVATPTAIFNPNIAPLAAASIMLAGRLSLNAISLNSTREGSVAGLSKRANRIPPGIAISEAASRYSMGTPKPA